MKIPFGRRSAGMLLVAVCASAGCSDSGRLSDDPAEPSAGQSKTEDRPDDAPGPEPVDPNDFLRDVRGGLEASTTAHMSIQLEMPGARWKAVGSVDYEADQPSMRLSLNMSEMSDEWIDCRLVGNFLYLDFGKLSHGKHVAFDLSRPRGLPPELRSLRGQLDPLAPLKKLERAMVSATFLGHQQIAGEQLDRYNLVLDPESLAALGADHPDLPQELEYQVWFDDQFRLRQMTLSPGDLPLDVRVTMTSWGEPVDVTAPPPDEVVDAPKFEGEKARV